MSTLVLKLVLTPMLIAAASLAQRRFGAVVGGLIVALPLTSAPVALFLALEQGKRFAEAAPQSARSLASPPRQHSVSPTPN